jgi:predicted HicB family RNase H-like nuclease
MGQFNFFIPDELHKRFKLYAVKKENDMRDILIELIKKEVDKK